ncbi:MAG: hypothetical protein PHE13_08255 [Bacteroidales bacterium]|nr:hypothetical protein [Bacteroidales bacterium]
MKNINKLLAILLLAIFAISCTNEEDYQGNNVINENNVINYKNLEFNNEYTNEYIHKGIYEYEQNNFSENDMISIMSRFSNVINNGASPGETYDINKAIFAMETFFNVAIVENQVDFENEDYEAQKFTTSIELNSEGKIPAELLRDRYITFINNVMSIMGNKFLQYSNIYVDSITSTEITIALEIPKYTVILAQIPWRYQVVRTLNDLYTGPINDTDDWNNYVTGSIDEVVRYYSKKTVNRFIAFNIQSQSVQALYGLQGYFAFTRWINDGTPMSVITGLSLKSLVNTCIIHANNYFATLNANYPSVLPRTLIDDLPVMEVRWDNNKRYMKLCYIKELTTCNVASVSLRDTLINVTVANRDIFDF